MSDLTSRDIAEGRRLLAEGHRTPMTEYRIVEWCTAHLPALLDAAEKAGES